MAAASLYTAEVTSEVERKAIQVNLRLKKFKEIL